MSWMRQVLLVSVAGACLISGPAVVAAAEAAATSGRRSLRGSWRAVSMMDHGQRVGEAQVRQLMFTFSEKTVTLRVGPRVLAETAYTIDAKAKPASIDMTFQGQATPGIYEFSGGKLRICLNDLAKGRPTKIPSEAGADCDVDLLFASADREWNVLHVMDADGSHPRVLVAHPDYTSHGSAEWSADGSKIGFDGWRSREGEDYVAAHILVCGADGQGLKDLGPGAMPSWSPDGKRITFSCYDPRGVWIMNSDGTGRELLDPEGWGAEWRPKRNEVSYSIYESGSSNIRVRDLAKRTSRDLLDGAYRQVYWGMAWSPDGQWLAFKGVSQNTTELAVVHAEGRQQGFRVLLPKTMPDVKDIMQSFAWSPDSKQILVGLITPGNPARQLYLIDAEGKVPAKPFPGLSKGRWYNDVAWSPDGKHILFTSPREEN